MLVDKKIYNCNLYMFFPNTHKRYYPVITQPINGIAMPFKVIPTPITKSSGLTIPVDSPSLSVNYIPNYGMNMFNGIDYFNQPKFNLTNKPMKPEFIPAIQPTPFIVGAPIIKNNIMGPQMNGAIKIIFGSNIATLNIPYLYFRKVVNDIYYRALSDIDPLSPKITVRIIGMGIDTTIQTTLPKILEIIRHINTTYSGINYDYNGMKYDYEDMYRKLG